MLNCTRLSRHSLLVLQSSRMASSRPYGSPNTNAKFQLCSWLSLTSKQTTILLAMTK